MILEIQYNFENSEISFTVSNVRENLDAETKFLKKLNTSTNVAATILNEKYKWNGASETATELDNLLNETWSAAERAINSGVENSVTIDRRGIRITDPNNPLHVIAIVAGWMGISSDGGNNYRTVLNADGVAAKYLIGQIVLAAHLEIINQGGNITIGETGISVQDQDGIDRIKIGDFGDFSDPNYVPGTEYGFYFKGHVDPLTGQEHYIEWNGSKLKIGGDLDAVTGTFKRLKAGSETSYMELYEEGSVPFLDFYRLLIPTMRLTDEGLIVGTDIRNESNVFLKANADGFTLRSLNDNVSMTEEGLVIVGNNYTATLKADEFKIESEDEDSLIEITNEGITVYEKVGGVNQLRVKLGYIGNVI
jgi:hypothetical protein